MALNLLRSSPRRYLRRLHISTVARRNMLWDTTMQRVIWHDFGPEKSVNHSALSDAGKKERSFSERHLSTAILKALAKLKPDLRSRRSVKHFPGLDIGLGLETSFREVADASLFRQKFHFLHEASLTAVIDKLIHGLAVACKPQHGSRSGSRAQSPFRKNYVGRPPCRQFLTDAPISLRGPCATRCWWTAMLLQLRAWKPSHLTTSHFVALVRSVLATSTYI